MPSNLHQTFESCRCCCRCRCHCCCRCCCRCCRRCCCRCCRHCCCCCRCCCCSCRCCVSIGQILIRCHALSFCPYKTSLTKFFATQFASLMNWNVKSLIVGWEPWSSGKGSWLIDNNRSWVRIPAPNTGWTCSHCCKSYVIWLKRM